LSGPNPLRIDMTILTTERLRLAPFDEAHLDGLNAINSDPEVMRYLGSPESRKGGAPRRHDQQD
jgi:RimJ/RimL family protein N-acetyltransferase